MVQLTRIELRRTPQGWWRYRLTKYFVATGKQTAMGALRMALRIDRLAPKPATEKRR